ncbi:MAG: cysteine hydrolase [Candidatus Omnitrophica bacterium]|nr:cysteine hydrolase [Candidatus Omnitrophota bacterium]
MERKSKAIIIVNMVKDFLEPKGACYCGRRARRIIPYVKRKLISFWKDRSLVIYLRDTHRSIDREFTVLKPHALVDTKGSDMVKELEPTNKDYIVGKRFYDGCFDTELGRILTEFGVRKVYLAGLKASADVMETAAHLFYLGYDIHVFKKGVADPDSRSYKCALKRMKSLFGCKLV